LTSWGKVLVKVMESLKGNAELEEGAVLAVELLRLGVLNADIGMFPTYNGAPMRGTGKWLDSIKESQSNHPQRKTNRPTC
jgi:hypothetical protein